VAAAAGPREVSHELSRHRFPVEDHLAKGVIDDALDAVMNVHVDPVFQHGDARHDDAQEDQQDRDGHGVEQGRLHAAEDRPTSGLRRVVPRLKGRFADHETIPSTDQTYGARTGTI
jgi:hypothetical protein